MLWCSAGQRACVGLLLRRWCLNVKPRTPSIYRCQDTPCSFFTSAPGQATHSSEEKRPLKQWTLTVNPFSTVRTEVSCSISVSPLDPHTFPEADRAVLTLRSGEDEQAVSVDLFHVHYDEVNRELLISADEVGSSVSMDLAAPLKSNLFITTRGNGNVEVKKMEGDICKVQTQRGNCLLHSVKAHQVVVQSTGGHVTGVSTIHGNVDIITHGDGAVNVNKLQGTSMKVSTEHGPLKVKAMYAESSSISSGSGNIQLGHVHGDATVKNVYGDTVINGSNKFLNVSSRSGTIDVYVGDGGSAELHSEEGSVCVRVPSSLRASVQLRGASVEISPEVVLSGVQNNMTQGQTTFTGCMNGALAADQWIRALAETGSVTLKTQSWFESLKLGS